MTTDFLFFFASIHCKRNDFHPSKSQSGADESKQSKSPKCLRTHLIRITCKHTKMKTSLKDRPMPLPFVDVLGVVWIGKRWEIHRAVKQQQQCQRNIQFELVTMSLYFPHALFFLCCVCASNISDSPNENGTEQKKRSTEKRIQNKWIHQND